MDRRPVLVVDDDEALANLMQMALEDEGYEVVTAENGAVALEMVRTSNPRLILLDLRMPVMTGWEFAREYRKLPECAPIVVVTAGREGSESNEDIGADAWVNKPFDLTQLLAIVARFTS